MATGVTKKEQSKSNTLTAVDSFASELPLPPPVSAVTIEYEGKSKESEILASEPGHFRKLNKNGKANRSKEHRVPINSFVLSDNFTGLLSIVNSNEKVNLFYLDPPYGTGMDFQSRDLEHAYSDSMGPASYLELMRRRLILMRECLDSDGSIYVHIGHQMMAHMKIIMDEIFGVQNFRNVISRKKCSSKNFTTKQYSNLNDYVLFYSKSKNYKWFQPGETPSQSWIDKEYPKTDDIGRKFKLVPIHAPGTRNGETGKQWKGMSPPPGKHWQYIPSKLDSLDAAGDIHWSRNGNPRRKVYWTSDKKISLSDYWSGFRDAYHQSIKITGYPTEKNMDMLKMIVGASSEEGDLVVDPFCGSGTTMQAALDLNRNTIGFDASFAAAKATLNRLRNGTEAMGDYVKKKKQKQQSLDLLPTETAARDITFLVESDLWEIYESDISSIAKI